MFDSHQKPTGTDYTMTASLVVMAVVLSPAILILSRPFGYLSVLLALSCSVASIAFAWIHWKNYSQLTIPSMETPHPRSKSIGRRG